MKSVKANKVSNPHMSMLVVDDFKTITNSKEML